MGRRIFSQLKCVSLPLAVDYILFLLSFLSEKLFSHLVLDHRGLLILYFQIERFSLVPVFSPEERGKRERKRTAGKEGRTGGIVHSPKSVRSVYTPKLECSVYTPKLVCSVYSPKFARELTQQARLAEPSTLFTIHTEQNSSSCLWVVLLLSRSAP